jgi:TatD DNase family protein
MVETDSPFLSPDPKRGTRPCVPAYARYTAQFLASIRNTPFEQFHEQIDTNAEAFFGIKAPKPSPEIIANPCTC